MKDLMPVLFIGHGSPMNALEGNQFTQKWQEIANEIPTPRAILAISAHWYIDELAITAKAHNQTIHDFRGFPSQLHNFDYPSNGDIQLAAEIGKLLDNLPISYNSNWGIDHGVWSILCHMYPNTNISILQLSIKRDQTADWHFNLGTQLQKLREQNVLILASGNIVHNLIQINWNMPQTGFDWATEFDNKIASLVKEQRYSEILEYQKINNYKLAIPTDEHFLPLIYALGAASNSTQTQIFNQQTIYGSLSMTSFIFTN